MRINVRKNDGLAAAIRGAPLSKSLATQSRGIGGLLRWKISEAGLEGAAPFPALALTHRSATFSSRLPSSGPQDVRGTPMAATFPPALMQPLSHSPARTSFSIRAMP